MKLDGKLIIGTVITIAIIIVALSVITLRPDYSASISILVSAFVIILGYVYTAQKQGELQDRISEDNIDLEERKIKYHSKLEAFREINEASIGMMNVYESLRRFLYDLRKVGPSHNLEYLIMMYIAQTRELEKPLDTNVTEKIIDKFEKYDSLDDSELRMKELREFSLVQSRIGLPIIFTRVLYHHSERFAKAKSYAMLLIDEPEKFQKALYDFSNYISRNFEPIIGEISETMDSIAEGEEQKAGSHLPDEKLAELTTSLIMIMRDDLKKTMKKTSTKVV